MLSKEELESTILYLILINIINTVITNNTEMEIGKKVVDGSISLQLLRPVNFFNLVFFEKVGQLMTKLIFTVIPLIFFSIYFFNIRFEINNSIFFILSLFLSFILVFIFEFIIGLCSFWTSQIFGLSLLKSSVISIFAGLTIPINFYPTQIKNIVYNLPFKAMFTIPVSIFKNTFESYSLIQKFIINLGYTSSCYSYVFEQIIWIFILSIIAVFIWKKCRKILLIQGG